MKETSNYKKYNSKNPVQKLLINNFLKTLVSCIKDIDVKTILDAGCGEGFILAELKKNDIGEYLEGIDFSPEALKVGREMFPFLVMKNGDIHNLPYKDNSFDLVVCTEVLEHIEDPYRAIDEIARISGRYCLFSVPNEPFFKIANFIRGKNLCRWGNDIDHIQCWRSREFENIINTRIDILTVRKPFPWTIVLGKKRN